MNIFRCPVIDSITAPHPQQPKQFPLRGAEPRRPPGDHSIRVRQQARHVRALLRRRNN
ncbi:hypothetical protein GCM10010339_88980 [Streptomyces alanosinicus]|uniref:Uncharacterized protein n=1 Tax=Streptomyces alanosinicus TaxID=68171 RepID=A0A918YTD2_9ACTN|nr:hypothetical protein GCM10010339_88980 [Streptomyces alanosinicus]